MMAPTVLPDTPFATTRAAVLGFSEKRPHAAVRDRTVVRLLRGVYLRAYVEVTVLIRAQAARLVLSPFVVVCDRTAAWIRRRYPGLLRARRRPSAGGLRPARPCAHRAFAV